MSRSPGRFVNVLTRVRLANVPVLALFLLFGQISWAEPSGDDLNVTYVGNAGYLLESGGRKVLIDALVADYHSQYVELSKATQDQLEHAQSPFDAVDLVLATHYHHDHFGPQAVSRYLMSNQKARFVSTPQALRKLRTELSDFEILSSRMQSTYPEEGTTRSIAEFGLKALNWHHGKQRRPLVENLGLIVKLGDWNVLHVGDTEIIPAEAVPHAESLQDIDVAMITTWFLKGSGWESAEQWRAVIQGIVNPRYIVLIHLPPAWRTDESQSALRQWIEALQHSSSDVLAFDTALETRTLSNR